MTPLSAPSAHTLLSGVSGVGDEVSSTSCCDDMTYRLIMRCPDHEDPYDCPDVVVVRSKRGEYGLPIHDGGESYIAIGHCPWCGKALGQL